MPRLSLDGPWELKWGSITRNPDGRAVDPMIPPGWSVEATVPGEIHLDLMRAGWLEDVYVGTNALAARWVEESQWTYCRTFGAPPDSRNARAWLTFQALDLVASVELNGERVGEHSNSFLPLTVEVTGLLEADNTLSVEIESGLLSVSDRLAASDTERYMRQERRWLRKAPPQFGIDWAPRLVNVGIGGHVVLEWTHASARIVESWCLTRCDGNDGHVSAHATIDVFEATRVELEIDLGNEHRSTLEASLGPGRHTVSVECSLASPKLWWPVGHGEQPMYSAAFRVRADRSVIYDREHKLAFRTVRLVQESIHEGGRLAFEINGEEIFARGACWAVPDIIMCRPDRRRYVELIDLALKANLNFLRVWGHSSLEQDDFYKLCDQLGILVWQEFPYSIAQYPMTDPGFFEDAMEEARYTIRRLAVHPSIVLWCGNNENDLLVSLGYATEPVPDHAFFHHHLPALIAREDGTRPYRPSSPYSEPGVHANSDEVGDQHAWSVGLGFFVPGDGIDFRQYRSMESRFPTEAGYLGPPALPTLRTCFGDQAFTHGALAWQLHDNQFAPFIPADGYTDYWLRRSVRDMSLEDFAYWGGVLQGEALREFCDNFRRRGPLTSGAVFHQFNDVWPVARGWAIVDYYGRAAPSYWFVRRAMAPVSLVLVENDDDEHVDIIAINDSSVRHGGRLRYGVFALDGAYLADHEQSVELAPRSVEHIASVSKADWVDPNSALAFAVLTSGYGVALARNRLVLPTYQELALTKPAISITLEDERAIFESSSFAWAVCVDLEGSTDLSDNFFDLYPGMPHAVSWLRQEPPSVLRCGNEASDVV